MAVTSIVCFGSFVWGVKHHFRSDRKLPQGMKAISVGNLAAIAWFFIRIGQYGVTPYWPLPFGMVVVALIVFWWTVSATRSQRLTLAFDDDQPTFLCLRGPYQRIRHPFYASYILFWFATSLTTFGIVQWLVPIAMAAAYLVAARREECKFAASPLAEAYKSYQKSAPMIVPLIWHRSAD
ncbi:MAG: hypothetical protein B7Z80_21890 [Rhodospirillales bacterium 20-64-7]|nr:MAG: hypothetical protein B7Z80_21890 [Rhodospirillales bacterium 20-64-7]